MVDSENDVRMSANCEVYKGANEFLAGQVCHSKAILICLGGFGIQKAQAWIEWGRDGMSISQAELRYEVVNESHLGQSNGAVFTISFKGNPNMEMSRSAM